MDSASGVEDTAQLEYDNNQLKLQNHRLSRAFEVQKRELAKKDETIETMKQRWSDVETSVLAIQRSWKQLSEDLIYLATKRGIEISPHEPSGNDSVFLDPFVRALLAPSSSTELDKEADEAVKTLEDFAEDVELEIKAEFKQVQSLLAQILDQSKDRPLEASHDSKTELEESYDRVRGLNRTLVEKSRLLEDKILKQDSELKHYHDKNAELQILYQNARKKIEDYRQVESKQQQETSKFKGGVQLESRKLALKTQPSSSTQASSKITEVEHKWLQKQIKTKTEVLEKEKSEHLKTQLDLQSMQNQLKDENRILMSGVFTSMLAQKDQLQGEVDKKNREIDKLHYTIQCKEQELSRRRASDPGTHQTTLEALHEAHKKSKDLRNQLIERDRPLQDRGGSGAIGGHEESYVLELKKLVKTSQEEVQRLKGRLKDKEDSSSLEKAREDNVELNRLVKSSEDKTKALEQSLEMSEKVKSEQSSLIKRLFTYNEHQSAFLKNLATSDRDNRRHLELNQKARTDCLISENQSLKSRLDDLDKPGYAELQIEVQCHQHMRHRLIDERQEAIAEKSQSEMALKHHKEDLDQLKQSRTTLKEELEATEAAFENIQCHNLKLVNNIKDKETEISDLKNEKLKLTHKIEVLNLELENLQEELKLNKTAWSELEKIKAMFQGKITDLQTGILQQEKALDTKENEIEDLHQQLSQKAVDHDHLQLELEVSKRTIDQKTKELEHETELLLNERSKRQKIEAESRMIEAFEEKIRSGSMTSKDCNESMKIQLLEEENESLKSLFNCNVCGVRPKDTILIKCRHIFCKQCIDVCVEKRRRRCPGCGIPFGQDDAKPFYLT